MGKRVLIAFIPQKKVVQNLIKVRKIAGIKVKKSSGLKTPHITIIDNSFSDIRKVDKELKEISRSFKPFTIKFKGIDTFVVKGAIGIEKYNQTNSLIYMVKNNPSINKFRRELIIKLNPLKTKERLKQWIGENPKLSKRSLANIEKYGTPFGLKEWKFHTTMGLIPKEKQKEILKKIKKLNFQGSWKIDHFGLFIRKNGWIILLLFSYQVSEQN
jgi:2'-5' RNA ligase